MLKLIGSAKRSLILIDNWATPETLDLFSKKRKGVKVMIITSEHYDKNMCRVARFPLPTSQPSTRSIRISLSALMLKETILTKIESGRSFALIEACRGEQTKPMIDEKWIISEKESKIILYTTDDGKSLVSLVSRDGRI